jgi:catechol 2,3-dioxygenase-like lactoylglutathione lyase family enzyme
MGLGQLMLFVSKLDVARSFYVDLLGLEVAHDMSKEGGMLIMKNDGAYLTIHEGFQPNKTPRENCRVVPIFRVSNIFEMREKLKAHNVEMHGDIVETPVHQYQTIRDFDGNWIEVAQFKN